MKILTKKKKNIEKQEKINDSRFETVHYDPKFLPASKKVSKTAIDSRFSNLFNDKNFKIVSEKDKYGRTIDISDKNEDMERLYYINDAEIPKEHSISEKPLKKPKKLKKSPENIEETAQIIEKPQKREKKEKKAKKTDEIQSKYYNSQGKFEWNEESSSESGESNIEDPIENVWDDEDENVPRNEDSSARLALMNYDWSHINAEDLMVLFNSLKPKGGSIQKITIYPSDFGLKHMEQEEKEGPTSIWEEEERLPLENEKKNKKHKKVDREINDWIANVNKPTEFDPIKLRKYEKDRLKYYYAIIDCDNKETAEYIYNESDGTEFELSGMKLDLRFVPEDQEFPYEAKEGCDYLPAMNKVNNFMNRAINHTNVELTWENPNLNRFDYLYNKNMKEEDWDKIDYSKILGEADISENEANNESKDEANIEEKGGNKEERMDWRSDFDKKNRRKPEEEMEIRFSSGFQDIGNKMLEKQKEKEESTWEKYLKKRKEKKKVRKMMEKNKMKDEDYFIEPESDEKDEKKYEEELELLVGDEKRHKRGEFKADVGDERFKAIYEDSKFGINPTHKDFKVEGSGKYLKEVVDRRKKIKKN